MTLLVLTAMVAAGLRWAVGTPSSGQLRQPAAKALPESAMGSGELKK